MAATAIAITLAHLTLALAWTHGWSGRLRALSLPLLASPHLALAIGLVLVLSPSGLLLRLLSPWATGFVQPPDWATVQDSWGIALICGLAIKETPFVILVLLGALAQVDAEKLMLQSSVLGYGRIKGWLVAVAPALHRQGRLAIAAVLIFGVTNVEMALPLGPSAPPTFSILLLRWFTAPDLALRPQAFVGAWLLLMTTIVCLASLYASSAVSKRLWSRWATSGARAPRDSALSGLIVASAAVAFGLGLLALVTLLLRTVGHAWRFPRVVPQPVSLDAWRSVAPDLGASLTTTVILGLLTAFVTVIIVLMAAESLHDQPVLRRRIGFVLFIPLLLPQMAYLFGWEVLLVRCRLDGTRFAVAWSHTIFALPYVWAVLADARASLNSGYRATAYVLGAGAARTWFTVTAPLLLRSILLALALAFSVSVAVYLPTLFAGAGRVPTLATEAAASIASGNIRSAAANAQAQMLAPFAMFAAAGLFGHALFRHRRGVPG
jgi:putative thiamine transport system permease protein